jgi:hypothetical protein
LITALRRPLKFTIIAPGRFRVCDWFGAGGHVFPDGQEFVELRADGHFVERALADGEMDTALRHLEQQPRNRAC